MDCVSKRSVAYLIDEVWQAYGVDTIDRFRDELLERLEAMPTMEGNMNKPMICDYCVHYGDVCRNMASPCYGHIVSSEDTCEDWDDESDSET